MTQLSDGSPVAAVASTRGLQLYAFTVPAGNISGFEVTATPSWGGAVGVVINPGYEGADDFYVDALPTCGPPCSGPSSLANFVWSSNTSSVRSRVVVRSTDPAWMAGITYYIGIYASAAAGYVVTASLLDSTIQLQARAAKRAPLVP